MCANIYIDNIYKQHFQMVPSEYKSTQNNKCRYIFIYVLCTGVINTFFGCKEDQLIKENGVKIIYILGSSGIKYKFFKLF